MPTLFVDEVKGNPYRLVAVCVQNGDIPRLRKALRAEVLSGQRSIHFVNERDPIRKKFLSTCLRLGFIAFEIDAGTGHEFETRPRALRILTLLAAENSCDRIILDLDESLRASDEKILRKHLAELQARTKIGFDHVRRHEEPIIWVADAIAWSLNRSGDWKARVEPMCTKFDA